MRPRRAAARARRRDARRGARPREGGRAWGGEGARALPCGRVSTASLACPQVGQLQAHAERVARIVADNNASAVNRFAEGVARIDFGDVVELIGRKSVGLPSVHLLLQHVARGRCTIKPAWQAKGKSKAKEKRGKVTDAPVNDFI